jgi:hypothetical protein
LEEKRVMDTIIRNFLVARDSAGHLDNYIVITDIKFGECFEGGDIIGGVVNIAKVLHDLCVEL